MTAEAHISSMRQILKAVGMLAPLASSLRTLVMEIYANASVFVQQLSQNKHTEIYYCSSTPICHTLYVGIADA